MHPAPGIDRQWENTVRTPMNFGTMWSNSLQYLLHPWHEEEDEQYHSLSKKTFEFKTYFMFVTLLW